MRMSKCFIMLFEECFIESLIFLFRDIRWTSNPNWFIFVNSFESSMFFFNLFGFWFFLNRIINILLFSVIDFFKKKKNYFFFGGFFRDFFFNIFNIFIFFFFFTFFFFLFFCFSCKFFFS